MPIDLRECKAEARRLLPLGHPVRTLFEAEPDLIEFGEAMTRLPLLLRIVLAHR